MATAAVATAAVALGVNYGVHVLSALAYGKFCLPASVWDVAQAVVSTASPVCSALLQTMTLTQNNYAVVLTTTVATTMAGVLKP
jgi:hypothetical protein